MVRSGKTTFGGRQTRGIPIDMWVWAIAAPIGFMVMISVLAWLEEKVVSPVDRATQISRLLERAPADEIEGSVARMLAPFVPHRNAS